MKPIRILHTSDFHMDSPFESLSEGKGAIRRAELRQLPQKRARLAAAEQVNLVLLCGDLLDSDSAFKETGEELINSLRMISVPVFISLNIWLGCMLLYPYEFQSEVVVDLPYLFSQHVQ